MKIKIFILVCFIFSGTSCKKNLSNYDLPIEREKLKRILLDIYLAGAATEMDTLINKDSLKQIYLTEICLIHKVKEEDLKTTLKQLNKSYIINGDIQRELLDSINHLNLEPLSDRPY